jgi:hypothetical protein
VIAGVLHMSSAGKVYVYPLSDRWLTYFQGYLGSIGTKQGCQALSFDDSEHERRGVGRDAAVGGDTVERRAGGVVGFGFCINAASSGRTVVHLDITMHRLRLWPDTAGNS